MILLIIFIIFLFLVFKYNQPDKYLPPGEWGLPVLGMIPYVKRSVFHRYEEIKHKFGDIFCIQMGARTFVFLRNSETIKAHFNKPELSRRPDSFAFSCFHLFKNVGIVFTSGPTWETNRRFTLKHLRDFGFGKASQTQKVCLEQAKELVKVLSTEVGQPACIYNYLHTATLNVTWGFIADKPFDQKGCQITEYFNELDRVRNLIISSKLALFDSFPFLKHITPSFIKHKWMKLDQIISYRERSHRLIKDILEEHRQTLNSIKPRNLIDSYFIEIENNTLDIEDPVSNMVAVINELFSAGSETISNALRWFFLYMGAYPEIQLRVLQEIDSVFSRDELPTLEHKEKLPYLEATIHEILRLKPQTRYGLAHTVPHDYWIEGYKIPKGAIIFPCIQECHMNPKSWKHPEIFDPERFLDKNGKFKIGSKSYLPFGYGKRVCPAETIAKMTLFMFAGAVVQNYEISFPKDAKIDLKSRDLPAHLNLAPVFKVILERRNED